MTCVLYQQTIFEFLFIYGTIYLQPTHIHPAGIARAHIGAFTWPGAHMFALENKLPMIIAHCHPCVWLDH
jgi:hypothetical protein